MKVRSLLVFLFAAVILLAGCASPATIPQTGATQAPQSSAPTTVPTMAPTVAATTAATAVTTAAGPQAGPVALDIAQTNDLGSFLVDAKGMTLYLFTKDTPNTSTCYDKCAAIWFPLLVSGKATAGTGIDQAKIGTTTRKDGTTQVTYNGWPLYYFSKDKQPGDVTGENVAGVWFTVSPAGDKVMSMQMPTGNANSNSNANTNSSSNSNGNTNSNGNSNSNSSGSGSAAQSGNVAVDIKGFKFNPSPLTVKVGSTVTWTNSDSAPHNVVADDGSFKSNTLNQGGTFSFTFTKAGTFPYYCSFHGGPGGQGMSATITVVP